MTDDIVDRLRKKYQGQMPICLEAADEIERLRKDVSRWRHIAKNLSEAWNKKAIVASESKGLTR